MKILELGSYIIPAYAGMILAEQGHNVVKWVKGESDPIHQLDRGSELWQWLNANKTIRDCDIASVELEQVLADCDAVIDNIRASTWRKWGIDPTRLATEHGVRWVSMRPDQGERSFDIIAQAQATMEYGPYIPWYIGDTSGGLWLAFKVLASSEQGHFILHQASCLQKLVEGELIIDIKRDKQTVPWDKERYRPVVGGIEVEYRGETITEPIRDRAWKLENMHHAEGRIII